MVKTLPARAVRLRAHPSSQPAAANRKARAAILALTFGALAVSLFRLGRQSFWLDEAYSWSTIDRPFPDLLRVLARSEGLQILHSLLLWPVQQVSDAEWVLRLPSAVAFTATVPALWLVGRRVLDDRAGICAAALLALNGWALQYAQEARAYALAMLTVTLAAAALVAEVQTPSRSSRIRWVLTAAAAVYVHGIMVLFVFAQWAALFAMPRDRWRTRRWMVNAGCFVLVALPALVAPALQVNTGRDYSWISRPGLGSIGSLAWLAAGRTVTGAPILLLAAGTVVLVSRRWRRDRWPMVMIAAWALLPPTVLIAASQLRPVYLDRYVLPMLPAVLLLAGAALSRIRSVRIFAALLIAVLALEARGMVRSYDAAPKEDWRRLSIDVLDRAHTGDAIAFAIDDVRLPFEYYAHDDARLARLEPLVPNRPWGSYKTGDHRGQEFQPSDINRIDRARPARLWIVIGYTTDKTMRPLLNQIRRRVGYATASRNLYQGNLEVVLLVRTPVSPSQ